MSQPVLLQAIIIMNPLTFTSQPVANGTASVCVREREQEIEALTEGRRRKREEGRN